MRRLILIMVLCVSTIFSKENNRIVSLGVNSDSFMGIEMGYGKELNLEENNLVYYLKINVPIVLGLKEKVFDTYEIKGGILNNLVNDKNYVVISDFGCNFVKHKDILGESYSFGVTGKISPSYRYDKGYVGLQLKYSQILTSYIKHSNVVKERFDDIIDKNGKPYGETPKDGFYYHVGSFLNLGIEGKGQINTKSDLYYELGMSNYLSKFTEGFDAVMFGQLPFYGSLQLTSKF